MFSLYYLFEISRWKKQASKGRLSNNSLKRLTKSGVRKPAVDYLSGFERGTNKKFGSTRKKYSWDTPGDSFSFSVSKNNASVFGPRKNRDDSFISKRHEADEIQSARNKKGSLKSVPFITKTTPMHHMSSDVVSRERDNINTLTSIYPHLKNSRDIKQISNMRKASGEYDYVTSVPKNKRNKIETDYIKHNEPAQRKQEKLVGAFQKIMMKKASLPSRDYTAHKKLDKLKTRIQGAMMKNMQKIKNGFAINDYI